MPGALHAGKEMVLCTPVRNSRSDWSVAIRTVCGLDVDTDGEKTDRSRPAVVYHGYHMPAQATSNLEGKFVLYRGSARKVWKTRRLCDSILNETNFHEEGTPWH